MRVEKKPEQKLPPKFVPPQPPVKILFLAFLTVALSAVFWLAWHNLLVNGLEFNFSGRSITMVVFALVAFCLMFAAMAITEVLITRSWMELLISLAAAATIFIFFKPTLWSFIAWLLMVLGFLYWRREIRVDEKSRIKFMPRRIVDSGLRGAVSLMLLASCFVYYSHAVSQPDAEEKIADSLTEKGVNAVSSVLKAYYKDSFRPEMSLDEFIANTTFKLGENIKVETGSESFDRVVIEGLSAAQQEIVDQSRVSFLETFGIAAAGSEAMEAVVSKIVRKNIDQYVDPYLKFLPALIALSLYFILGIFSFIYRELIKSFSQLVFIVLVWLKFIKVEKIQIEAEKITL